jgi:hypothetical protein
MPESEDNLRRKKSEEKLIRDYWKWRCPRSSGHGTLIREYEMVNRTGHTQRRCLDAILILNGEHRWIGVHDKPQTYLNKRRLNGHDEVEFVQAKVTPLGMSLLGQTLFSRSLMNKKMREHKPTWRIKSRRWVALCNQTDDELGGLASDYGIDVVVRQGRKFIVAN